MENWGLITYRETSLLFSEAQTSVIAKQWIAVVIAHELAHQWFGNLVTMRWWNDLWLNEGSMFEEHFTYRYAKQQLFFSAWLFVSLHKLYTLQRLDATLSQQTS